MDGVLIDFELGINSLNDEELKSYENKLDEVPVLIHQMMPIIKVHAGYLETNFGIHLKQTPNRYAYEHEV
jgi:hypothetical protein